MRHFLSLTDYTSEELNTLIGLAVELKQEFKSTGKNMPDLADKVLAMVFQKPSLRTRVSFDMAMRHLGGDADALDGAQGLEAAAGFDVLGDDLVDGHLFGGHAGRDQEQREGDPGGASFHHVEPLFR